MDEQRLRENSARVCERIASAARRAGRSPDEVTLVAVSKTHSAESVAMAYRAGLRLFGENRVEGAGSKAAAVGRLLAPAPPPTWHMIGHLQSRKAGEVWSWAEKVQSVDSFKLAARLSRYAIDGGQSRPRAILLEVNVAGEANKFGFTPQQLPDAVAEIAALPGLQIEGLMTMAPVAEAADEVRPVFAELRRLRDDLARLFPTLPWSTLSMGMTDDFEVAVEEGATLVRIGRAIFGAR